jgi:hypothetical protein
LKNWLAERARIERYCIDPVNLLTVDLERLNE